MHKQAFYISIIGNTLTVECLPPKGGDEND